MGGARSNAQARLIAAGLALVAAAIYVHAIPQGSSAPWALGAALVLFVVEYSRTNLPDRGRGAEPGAAPDRGDSG
jgi:hypothetical protein